MSIYKIYADRDYVDSEISKLSEGMGDVSWDDLKDKPFGEKVEYTKVNAINLPATSTFSGGVYWTFNANVFHNLAPTCLYVPYNEKKYTGVYAFSYTVGTTGATRPFNAYGNLSLLTEDVIHSFFTSASVATFDRPDTGEDFVVCIQSERDDRETATAVIVISRTEGFNIGDLYAVNSVITLLDPKYLPKPIPAEYLPYQRIVFDLNNGTCNADFDTVVQAVQNAGEFTAITSEDNDVFCTKIIIAVYSSGNNSCTFLYLNVIGEIREFTYTKSDGVILPG